MAKRSKTYGSNRKLAKALSVDESAVRRWRKRSDWPFGDPPWSADDLPAIESWRAEALGDSDALQEARVDLISRQAEHRAERNTQLAGRLIPRQDARREVAALSSTVERELAGKRAITAIMRSIRPHLVDAADEAGARAIVAERLGSVARQFRAQVEAVVDTPRTGTPQRVAAESANYKRKPR